MDDDLDIGIDFGNDPNDSVLLGLDSLMAIDDVTNPFDFEWRIAPVEAVSTVCTVSLETILHKNLPTRGLLICKQLSTDTCNTIFTENSSGNAPNNIYILTDEVYTNVEKVMLKQQ